MLLTNLAIDGTVVAGAYGRQRCVQRWRPYWPL